MAKTCNRCNRVNPNEASYCYFDGAILASGGKNGGPVKIGAQLFPNQFVFPTGQTCRSFDQLAVTCQQNWKAAVDVLKGGYLENFLGGLGRSDLALAAREAARFPDIDRGLDQFLAKIPSDAIKPPKLAVEPTAVNLGQLKPGEDRKIELHLNNQGMRLIYGSISSDSLWLSVGAGKGASRKLFQFGSSLVIPVAVLGKHLRASDKPLQAKLVVETNAGTVTVFVKGELPVKPYVGGLFAGARSPRQVAEKAKANPRDAAALFENGAVSKWYKDNGWIYPVQGPTSYGLGAVQQYFEALGLTPPPKVEISERAISLKGDVGGQVQHAIEVKALEKRPIYAHAVSDQPWLVVGKAQLNGRSATIPLAAKVPNSSGQTLKANLMVKSNGNQKFIVPVTLAVGGAAAAVVPFGNGSGSSSPFGNSSPSGNAFAFNSPSASSSRSGAAPVISVARRSPSEKKRLAPAVLLVLALGIVVLFDLFNRSSGQAGPNILKPPDDVTALDNTDIDPEPVLDMSYGPRERFGVRMPMLLDGAGLPVRLTYSTGGETNNTCIKLDNQESLYAQTPGKFSVSPRDVAGNDPRNRLKLPYHTSTWKYTENVLVTQTVILVPNSKTSPRKLDTILIHYTIENRDNSAHTVGLRMMFDTFIGREDGVPFVIPTQKGLMSTKIDLDNFKDIPDYIQALEKKDPANPGVVVTMQLKLPPDLKVNQDDPPLESINRMVISRWPKNPEIRWDFTKTAFWAMDDKSQGAQGDSCVTLYWEYRKMNPKEKRAFGFTYGLGQVSDLGNSGGKLALTYGPTPAPGEDYTVTAWVKSPKLGQQVTLQLPKEMSFVNTPAMQTVDRGTGDLSQVSWKVHVDKSAKPGLYPVKAFSDGKDATVKVKVRSKSSGGNSGGIFDSF